SLAVAPARAVRVVARTARLRLQHTVTRRDGHRMRHVAGVPRLGPSAGGHGSGGRGPLTAARVTHQNAALGAAPRASSYAAAIDSRRDSAKAGPVSWRPTGSPWPSSPQGTLMAGSPARFALTVNTSARYIWSGSSIRSPRRKAVVGLVGMAT